MAVIIDIDMPKSCDVCPYHKVNEDIASDDPRHSYCGQPYMGEYVTDYIASRHPECPMEDAREYIAKGDAQDVIKHICEEYGIGYDESDRWKEANNSAYKLGHAFVE